MWTIVKVLLNLFYVFLFWPRGMWDLSFPTRDQVGTPCTGRRCLNHWTTREAGLNIITLQIRKLRLRESNELTQSHSHPH